MMLYKLTHRYRLYEIKSSKYTRVSSIDIKSHEMKGSIKIYA